MERFDRRALKMFPLSERDNKLDMSRIAVTPDSPVEDLPEKERTQVTTAAESIASARNSGKPVVLTFGAHLIKNGLAPVVIRLMEDGWITHVATNGAGSIHDWEFAYQGKSTEDVRTNTANGQFGIWEETGRFINLAVAVGGTDGLGYGESIGRMIADDGLTIPSKEELLSRLNEFASQNAPDERLGAVADLIYLTSAFGIQAGRTIIEHPHKDISVQCAAYKLRIPFTVHPGIGYDIIYSHPMNCGGAIGRGAVRDFLAYAESIRYLSGGAHITVGSAIMAPMIFEKSLSMANNLSILETGKALSDYHLFVVDIQDGGEWDWRQGEPPMDHPAYYLRFCKSFYRMGGTLDYLCIDNRKFMLGLCQELRGMG